MALPDTSVKHFSSDMPGAPVLSGTAGTLIEVLDACLVNGFGSVSVDSLSVTDNVATAVVSAGHGLSMIGSTGPVILISGATPTGLNGEWRVASVPNSTTFTFATEGLANGTASGSIAAKRAPAGWEKRYSGTNKAAYARLDPAATAMLLRVDDTPANLSEIRMYESMTDIDSGSGVTPSSGTEYCAKRTTASATATQWAVASDGRAFYLFNDVQGASNWAGGMFFGDILPYKGQDAYACLLLGSGDSGNYYSQINNLNVATKSWLARSYTGVGGAVAAPRYSHQKTSSRLSSGGLSVYPNPADNAMLSWPIEVWETTSGPARGLMPGIYNGLNPTAPHGEIIVGTHGLNGRTLRIQRVLSGAESRIPVDLTGPWR